MWRSARVVRSLSLEGQSSSEIRPLRSPLAIDCYLALQWRLAVPLGRHECACQQECIGGNRGRWRMVSSCCCCFFLCVKMSPLIQPPPLPLPQPSLCLLSLFVSEMIPSVMSKATLSYSCCLGNQRWERQRLKAFMVFEAGKHERLSVVLWEFESWHIWKGLIVWIIFSFLFFLPAHWEIPPRLLVNRFSSLELEHGVGSCKHEDQVLTKALYCFLLCNRSINRWKYWHSTMYLIQS